MRLRSTRRAVLLSALGTVVGLPGYARYVEPRWLDVTHKRIPVRGGRLRREVRILQLSDLHSSEFVTYSQIAEAIDLGLRQKPDFAVLTGDFITRRMPDPAEYKRTLRPLTAAVPTYAVLGNHDGGLWVRRHLGYDDTSAVRNVLDAAGVDLLHNTSRLVRFGGQPLRLTGVGDLWAREIDAEAAFREADPGLPEPHVVLAHNPDSRFVLDDRPWDVMLSGHTHGGQVIVPIIGYAPFVSVSDPRFLEGLQPWNGRLVHITRGVGNLLGWRLACRPEVSILTLTAA